MVKTELTHSINNLNSTLTLTLFNVNLTQIWTL